jgi:eukaryotic-like serine/threonine-protein kinase
MDSSPVPFSRDLFLSSGVLPLAPQDPATVGGHLLVGLLGVGGMGRVYLGRDQDGGLVAVKVAHASAAGDEEVQARFRAEADCLRRVPALCTARLLVDGTDRTPPYIITEYIAGRSLKDVVERDGPLPPEQLRALAAGVVRTLTAIHRAGLVHRDLKPANVLLTPTGPRVIDFGIARQVSASGGPTGTGMIVGSIGWIAPERLTHNPATPAADVFGWGCLIAYAGTARNPFGSGDAEQIARRAMFEPPNLDGLDTSVRALVAAALAKSPADRPSSACLLARLSPTAVLAESEPPSRTETNSPPAESARPRRKTATATIAAATVVTIAATAITWIAADTEQTAPRAGNRPAVQNTPHSPAATDAALLSRGPITNRPAAPRTPIEPATRHKPPAQKSGHDKKPKHAKRGHRPR